MVGIGLSSRVMTRSMCIQLLYHCTVVNHEKIKIYYLATLIKVLIFLDEESYLKELTVHQCKEIYTKCAFALHSTVQPWSCVLLTVCNNIVSRVKPGVL